jgi:hypothetical protein
VVDYTGQTVQQGDLSGTVALSVFDMSSTDVDSPIFTTNRVIGNTVFDSLQTWSLDGTGYNFQDTVTTGEVALEGGHTYRLCYRFNATNGTIPVVFEWAVQHLLYA